MAKSKIAGLPQPRAAKVRTVRKVVRLEPSEHRAQVAAAKREGKTWSDWIRLLAAREVAVLSQRQVEDDDHPRRMPPAIEAGEACEIAMESTPC